MINASTVVSSKENGVTTFSFHVNSSENSKSENSDRHVCSINSCLIHSDVIRVIDLYST